LITKTTVGDTDTADIGMEGKTDGIGGRMGGDLFQDLSRVGGKKIGIKNWVPRAKITRGKDLLKTLNIRHPYGAAKRKGVGGGGTWTKGSRMRSRSAFGTPMPVSITSNW